jgi:GTP-binding protein
MSEIRNVAIIAHVDHGKTTLVDQLLQASGLYRDNQMVVERAMDSMDLEREKGITIRSKNTAIRWNDHTINIVDTPGHADFGGEVERVMRMVDGVLLVVDAYEGPQAQTRFVLRKALEAKLFPVLVINKIDRANADPEAVLEKVHELLLDLGATDEQFDSPAVFGSAKNGFFKRSLDDEDVDMTPLLETILERVPPPEAYPDEPFRMLVSNITWDDYVGRVAMGKVLAGSVKKGERMYRLHRDGTTSSSTITRLFAYSGLGTQDSAEGLAGDIVGIAGFEDVDIGETLASSPTAERLPFVEIDPPTVQMQFSINDGPFAGRDGKNVTSRAIRDRLQRESKTNISILVEDTDQAGIFNVSARGVMQISVMVEHMRREGYEILISRPTVITKTIDGQRCEPFETLYVEVSEEHVSPTMKALVARRAQITSMLPGTLGTTIEATIPTRGLIGFELELLNITSGHGVMSHLFLDYQPWAGDIATRHTGTLVSMATGPAMAYSLDALEARGRLFVGPGEEVYQGQIVGENPRKDDLPVNPTKEKHLTNHRSSGDGKGIQLTPPTRLSLERAIEYIGADELVEATPNHLRLRKRVLDPSARRRETKRTPA